MSGKSKKAAGELAGNLPGGVHAPGDAVAPCKKNKDPQLKVRVWGMLDGKKRYVQANVKANALAQSSVAKTGLADFSYVLPGTYQVSVAALSAPDDRDFFASASTVISVRLAKRDKRTVDIEVQAKSVVKPKIEVEYKVVLVDRGLGDDKRLPDPTYVELSLEESVPAFPYKDGAKFRCSPALVEVYFDKELKKKVAGDLTGDQFGPGKKTRLWLKGLKTGGKFNAIVELKPPTDPRIRLGDDNPAQVEMGAAEIVMEVHHFDLADLKGVKVDPAAHAKVAAYHKALHDKGLPDQKALTDKQKTTDGRMLHVQKDGHFGRAKIRLKKLVPDQWPAGTDDYHLVITQKASDGAVAVFDAETGGKEVKPAEFKVGTLKSAEKIVWLEGRAAVKKKNELIVGFGLDRAEGGLAKEAKAYGDWAAFTVLQIKEVKFEVSNDAGKVVVYDSAKKRLFVNTDDDSDGRALTDKPAKGKKIKVTATLTEKIDKVPLHFLLSNHKKNFTKAHWGSDLPATFEWMKLTQGLKAVDKAAAADLLHLGAETDANGVAKMDKLVVSRFGGDLFKIGVYMRQDPHLAKYVHGHADLAKRAPVFDDDEFQVWRRVWVQLSVNKDSVLASRALSTSCFEHVFVDYQEVDEKKFDKTSIAGLVEHERWQFEPGKGTAKVICVGNHNKAKFHGLMKPESAATKPKCHLVMCDAQWDPVVGPKQDFDAKSANPQLTYKNATGDSYLGIFDPPLGGGTILDTSTNPRWEWTDAAGTLHKGTFVAADVTIQQARTHTTFFKVNTPAVCPATCPCGSPGTAIAVSATKPMRLIDIQLNAATGPWAGESGSAASPHCLIVIDSDANAFNNTITHEIGHLFDQVRTAKNYSGLPDHPHQYVKRGGQGSHCHKSATLHPTEVDEDGAKAYVGGTCTMFHVAVGNTSFCHDCGADLRVRDLSGFGK
jgi:hypothetical protein